MNLSQLRGLQSIRYAPVLYMSAVHSGLIVFRQRRSLHRRRCRTGPRAPTDSFQPSEMLPHVGVGR
ncbi:hypothetical protein OH76DRAFT_235763 [Lentinus brumalis]|uniref:Uncharacterized protein n=1 Tax=Lentinus brumalis TaxID=2498619 RepID=A0A371DHH5_9APHY|nr:hypothetical protein OH76DRAFT_235763 [Polyporus brumalis]